MVRNKDVQFPAMSGLRLTIERCTAHEGNVYLDAEGLAERLFGDYIASNLIVVGAAYQAGAIPLDATSIEETIRLNGVAVEMNLQAFRWGRLYVQERGAVERQLEQLGVAPETIARPLIERSSRPADVVVAARALLVASGFSGEVRRLAEIRIPELIRYQSPAYARQYVEFLRKVVAVEGSHLPGQTQLGEAVARYLFKLMAYKDEYEVARLLLNDDFFRRLRAEFGAEARPSFNLHPPLLRALGLKHKLRLGLWCVPLLKALRALRHLRGTPVDIFGYARIRRVERRLSRDYRQLIEALLADLNEMNYPLAVQLAELPDMIRGYEDIKLRSVEVYHLQLEAILAKFRAAKATALAT
jgi:indolepyruvate ferredoxin oxidoreductase